MNKEAEQGFTLLEIMVAMAIVSIALVTIIELFAGGIHVAERSYDYTRLSLLAKEKMNRILMKTDLEEGEFSGDFTEEFSKDPPLLLSDEQQGDPYQLAQLKNLRWEYTVSPYEPKLNEEEAPKEARKKMEEGTSQTDEKSASEADPKLFTVDLKVLWDEREKTESIALTSLALIIPKSEKKSDSVPVTDGGNTSENSGLQNGGAAPPLPQ